MAWDVATASVKKKRKAKKSPPKVSKRSKPDERDDERDDVLDEKPGEIVEVKSGSLPPGGVAAVPLHKTAPIEVGTGPERFTSIPDSISAPPPIESSPEVGTPPADPSAVEPEASSTSDSPPKESADTGPARMPGDTTPEEAKMFGQLLSMYFQAGNAALFAKHPNVPMAFAAFSANLPELQQPDGSTVKLTPEQAYATLCKLVAGCGERVAMKYNLRIPYLDEAVVIGAIGIATYGFVPKKKPKAGTVGAAKDANPKSASTNGASTNPQATAAAQEANETAAQEAAVPGAPLDTSAAEDLDAMA